MRFIGVYDYTVILTYMSLFSAVFGMLCAAEGRFHHAIGCLFIAGICDAFDGIVARSKKNRTDDEKAFGIQLDSLCDVISFGVFPSYLCHFMGVDGFLGLIVMFLYCMCAVCRLAFFNVLEANRQKTEGGCNRTYRGLPVTSIAIILPIVYLLHFVMPEAVFSLLLHAVLMVTAFLFILDFSVPKPNIQKMLSRIFRHS